MQTQTTINGINVEQLRNTITAITDKPSLAIFRFRAENKWMGGSHNRSSIGGFYGAGQEDTTRTTPFVLDSDEPQVLLGEDKGANPTEYALHALAGCLTTSLVAHAAARGIRIEEIESRLEGKADLRGFLGLSDEVRNGYEEIRVTFRIKAEAPPETLRELVELAQQRSPVFDIFTNPTPVTVRLEGVEAPKQRRAKAEMMD